ncbi:MAG: 16S rRNA (adenine(1518)-N(6)/adenine(1519)-N(6))-dimethyltransferase RsmA [Eubacteriales bacterium]|nr:16S rRNA (adenine(1518)-N(6)/adenine(1519)-N(6))-dimethyltransferase RsmA [Eubacteriales bacterium]
MNDKNPKAKKRYGQNFLTGKAVPERIAREAGIGGEHGVLEIGPGRGILTEQLAVTAKKTVAVEIDRELIPFLNDKFVNHSNVTIVEGDILETDIAGLINEHFRDMPVSVCANIPYYITSPILLKLIEGDYGFDTITVMVQKEVAQRLTAKKRSGEYSSLTVLCSYYASVKKLFDVPAGCFSPRPKVDSAVVRFDIYKAPPVNPPDIRLFFKIIRLAFAYRRKTLLNCLAACPDIAYPKEVICDILTSNGFSPNVRGEELDIYDFDKIARFIRDRER